MLPLTATQDRPLLWRHKYYIISSSSFVKALPCRVINLQTQQRTASYPYNASLPDPTICVGTHSIVYSTINKQCDSADPTNPANSAR